MNKPADKKDQLTRWEDRAAAEIAEGLGIPLNAFMRTRVRDQFLDAPMKGWVFRVTGSGGMGDIIAKHAPKAVLPNQRQIARVQEWAPGEPMTIIEREDESGVIWEEVVAKDANGEPHSVALATPGKILTVEDLYDAISAQPLRVKAAAAKFGVPEAVIREMIAHPDSNLVIKQAGWIQRRAA
jgi:hypothetical protein